MRIAIVGAGALGIVYGARLSSFGDCEICLVGRSLRAPSQLRLERVQDGEVLRWSAPAQLDAVPARTDVVMACVRYEGLDGVAARLADTSAPLVVMTPILPADHARLSAALPGRVRAGMPSVVSYRNDAGAIRYWLPRAATTHVEVSAPDSPEAELVRRLGRADIRALGQKDVLDRNVATTVSFVPLAMALDLAGGIDSLLENRTLLALAIDATREGQALGRAIGKGEAWAAMLLRFVGPRTLRMCVAVARSRADEAVRYVDHHFGRKLHAQNVAMAAAIVNLAQAKGTEHASLATLSSMLQGQR